MSSPSGSVKGWLKLKPTRWYRSHVNGSVSVDSVFLTSQPKTPNTCLVLLHPKIHLVYSCRQIWEDYVLLAWVQKAVVVSEWWFREKHERWWFMKEGIWCINWERLWFWSHWYFMRFCVFFAHCLSVSESFCLPWSCWLGLQCSGSRREKQLQLLKS